jgi:cobalt-zinc-cadmium efflux system membrane fusion protein
MTNTHVPGIPAPSLPDRETGSEPAPAQVGGPTWGSRLAALLMPLLIVVLVTAALAVSGLLPLGWLLGEHEPGTTTAEEGLKVDLVKGKTRMLHVPLEVRKALGMRKGDTEQVAVAQEPRAGPPLVLPGSTALDPTRLLRVRARFAPAEVVKIGTTPEQPERTKGGKTDRELRSGDRVRAGEVLGVFFSIDVGNKKNDLYDALVQLKLDEEILERAEAGRGTVPEVFLLNARRSVLADRNAITRAENTLRAWGIAQEDLDAVHKEADRADLDAIKADKEKSKATKAEEKAARERDKKEKLERWARVELKAPFDATIVERNVAQHEIVVDGTTNLFVLARVDRIAVVANAPEDDLPLLQGLSYGQRFWTIHTVGAPADKGIEGPIDEIGYLIDPNQHTAVVKGYIDNPPAKDGSWRMRGGQFVSVTIQLPPPRDVVEVPMSAVVDDGKQCVVLVQPNSKVPHYELRRVILTHRFDTRAFVRSVLGESEKALKPAEKEQGVLPPEPLRPGERVITSGVLELKKELEDREAQR